MRLFNYTIGRITNANKIIQSKNEIQIFLNIQHFPNLFKNSILLHLRIFTYNIRVTYVCSILLNKINSIKFWFILFLNVKRYAIFQYRGLFLMHTFLFVSGKSKRNGTPLLQPISVTDYSEYIHFIWWTCAIHVGTVASWMLGP